MGLGALERKQESTEVRMVAGRRGRRDAWVDRDGTAL